MKITSPARTGTALARLQLPRGLSGARGCVVAYRRCPACGSRLYVSAVAPVYGCDGGCSEPAILSALASGGQP